MSQTKIPIRAIISRLQETDATERKLRKPLTLEKVRAKRTIAVISANSNVANPNAANPSVKPPATAPKPVALFEATPRKAFRRAGTRNRKNGTQASSTPVKNRFLVLWRGSSCINLTIPMIRGECYAWSDSRATLEKAVLRTATGKSG